MNRPTPWHHPKRWGSAVVVWALLAQAVVPAHAFVSQLPGVYNTPPDVNVMFTLDDSGSMYSEAIPDYGQAVPGMPIDARSAALPGFGQATTFGSQFPALWYERLNKFGVLQSSAYLGTAYYQSTNSIARFLRSSAGNPLYYDPQVSYKPWPLASDDTKLNAAADPAAVNIHPANPFDTTQQINIKLRRASKSPDTGAETDGFWPATYFLYTGTSPLTTADMQEGGKNVSTNFSKVEIKPAVTSYPRGDDRNDCAGTTCTYDEEIKNFANWLQYYHSRMLMAKGGVAAAFARQGTNLRVGFATINSPGAVRLGVKQFRNDTTVVPNITNRTSFYNELYPIVNAGGTPLREAMDKVGQYFTGTTAGNPWAEDPTASVVGKEYACRRSFHILSTDGFWNGNAASGDAAKNNDNFTGLRTPKRPDGTDEAYADTAGSKFTISPYADANDNTLADVAAYYWKTDLRTDLDNKVVATKRDPAFWQHLTTYTIGLGITGSNSVTATVAPSTTPTATLSSTLATTDPLYDFRGEPWLKSPTVRDWLVANRVPLNWPVVNPDSPQTGDDLVHASMVGRGNYFSATNPADLANGLAAALAEAVDQQLDFASLAVDSSQLISGGKAYQATFNPSGWSGRLYAFSQGPDGSVINTPSTTSTPNASQVWEASNKMPAPTSRNIYTSNGGVGTGKPFLWANLTLTQQGYLGKDKKVLDYLRGDDTNELLNGGNFRDRARYTLGTVTGGVLGDIVGSSPLKGPDAGGGYDRLPTTPTSGQATYATFRSTAGPLDDMRDTVFVGANDGMLHAFNFTTGVERFAYVPSTLYNVPRSTSGGLAEQKLRMLSDPGYTHRFTVDGPPNVADAYYGGAWHSLLVGATGAGARGIFTMDVTKPEVGSSGFGTTKLLWEYTEADSTSMGFVLAYPHVVRLRNDKFAVVFGNGYDSATGNAVLYIRDAETGADIKTFTLDSAGSNGLSQPNFVLNDSREVIAIYAGDLKGNLWKIDVSGTDSTTWAPAFGAGKPLFTAIGPAGKVQPISVMPEISAHKSGGAMITFGTGKLFESSDTANDATNVNLAIQSIYGVWDKPAETTGITMTTANRGTLLQAQSLKTVVATDPPKFRRSTALAPDWATQRGWVLDLEAGGERANLPSQQFRNVIFTATNTPATADPCASGGTSKIFALDPLTGAAPSFPVFDANDDKKVNGADNGLNVLLNGSALLTQPVFQIIASGGTVLPSGPTLQPIAAFDRGQATAARPGGVQLSRANGMKSSGSTGSGTVGDCDAIMSAAQSNTSLLQMLVKACGPGKARISWRQLK